MKELTFKGLAVKGHGGHILTSAGRSFLDACVTSDVEKARTILIEATLTPERLPEPSPYERGILDRYQDRRKPRKGRRRRHEMG